MSEGTDNALLERFEQEVWSKVPHLEEGSETKVVNATPLVDMTADFKECAKSIFKLNLDDADLKVFGKMDSSLLTGSIKVRPAANIIHDAIVTGNLKSGQTVIEATSGNFGIALGLLSKLGLNVIAPVSRKLQEGVFEELRNGNTRTIDLDMDICPAPGMEGKQDLMVRVFPFLNSSNTPSCNFLETGAITFSPSLDNSPSAIPKLPDVASITV
jgi:hypothetical protein